MVLFGGRNDENSVTCGTAYLNDVWILTLEKLTWAKWDTKEKLMPVARYSHCATVIGSSLLIFGGLSEENYCRSSIYALETEPNNNAHKINDLLKGKRNNRFDYTIPKEVIESVPQIESLIKTFGKTVASQEPSVTSCLPAVAQTVEQTREEDISKISGVKGLLQHLNERSSDGMDEDRGVLKQLEKFTDSEPDSFDDKS